MIEQQRQQLEAPQEPERRFAAVLVQAAQNNLVATVRVGDVSQEVYSGGNADVVAALWKPLCNA